MGVQEWRNRRWSFALTTPPIPTWTIRGTGGGVITVPIGKTLFGVPDDLVATNVFNLLDDRWHFYGATFDAITGLRKLYVDGQLAASETGNRLYSLAPEEHLCIGARDTAPGNNFNAFSPFKIYDVRIYNFAFDLAFRVEPVSYHPTITRQPQSVSAAPGSPVQFSVAVASDFAFAGIAYQWKLNGTNVNQLPDSTNFLGANSAVLNIIDATPADAGAYQVLVKDAYSFAGSSNATLTVQTPNLVGEWLAGAPSLADVSGYAPAGTHDGYAVGNGNYIFTNDVPPGKTGQSLFLYNADTGIAISNSSTLDASYTNTFDDAINNAMTVAFWAKGFPGSWRPWVPVR